MTLKSGTYMLIMSFLCIYILQYSTSRFGGNIFLFRFWRYFLSYAAGISLYLLFWHVFASYAGILSRSNDIKWLGTYTMIAIVMTTVVIVLQDLIIIRRVKIQNDLEYSRLQTRNKEAENLLLKQQIQPHFLFNALSTLKSLINTDPEKSERYLMNLAEFLRASVSHNKSFTATLEEELSICRNYLELQKIRFGDALEWELVVEENERLHEFVPSLSLQPLLENAIKHNVLTKFNPLKIAIRQRGEVIEVLNNVNPKTHGDSFTKSGLGNLAARYNLLTGDNIDIVNDGAIFSVSFKILKHEGSNN